MKKYLIIFLSAVVLTACNDPLTERRCMDFLYTNLSLPDRTDYDSAYYVRQVQTALQARHEQPWGKQVPEREFLHFVVPPRVNNEDLDDFRTTYYAELSSRVEDLTMEEAILEVNHWCHEHVTYRPTSSRTLGPASTIRTAYGRCGEESVLLVAALRTVGIPARQVYTPRWAHTDDNHAWVEAWADGKWHFLGACEPEPVLDLGWFNESASRGMLMHTRVFGNYDGPEEVVKQEHNLTEINVTDIYAPTSRLTVEVRDSAEQPVAGATVEFKLYNYAEFYTVAAKQTGADGRASLSAGLGDMVVWASTPTAVAFQQVTFGRDSLVTLHLTPLNQPLSADGSLSLSDIRPSLEQVALFAANGFALDITPPAAKSNPANVTAEQRAENNHRLSIEDSIRHAYEATMTDQRSRGNHAVIQAFRDSAAAMGLQEIAEQLITVLPDKDLQDVTIDVLMDNLQAATALTANYPSEVAQPYLLSPRIERERLTAFKAPLREAFQGFDVNALIAWTRDSLRIIDDQNPQNLRMQPLGVYRTRTADRLGRDIFFVAACRAMGIPARINEINGKLQYVDADGQWIDVNGLSSDAPAEEGSNNANMRTGVLRLAYTAIPHLDDPKYYTHFTLSRLDEHNQWQLLTYPEEATFDNTFAGGVTLDEGIYLLTTGVRMANGSVRAQLQTFEVKANGITNAPLQLRAATDAIAVIGSLNAEDLYQPITMESPDDKPTTADAPTSLLATCGRGYYVLGFVAPNQEPTNHALRDISLVSKDLEAWGRKIVLLFEDTDAAARFNFAEFTGLPSTTVWGTDIDGAIKQEAIEQLNLTSGALPLFLVCDSFNRVVFVQQGYTIGLGEQLMKVIHGL